MPGPSLSPARCDPFRYPASVSLTSSFLSPFLSHDLPFFNSYLSSIPVCPSWFLYHLFRSLFRFPHSPFSFLLYSSPVAFYLFSGLKFLPSTLLSLYALSLSPLCPSSYFIPYLILIPFLSPPSFLVFPSSYPVFFSFSFSVLFLSSLNIIPCICHSPALFFSSPLPSFPCLSLLLFHSFPP